MKPAWLACCLGLMAWAATPAVADDYWKFKQIQGQPLEARVSRYDVDQQLAILVTRDGVEVQLSVAELDTPDKRLLARALERSLFHKPKTAPPREAAAAAAPARPVVWHKNFQQAATEARAARPSEADTMEPANPAAAVADADRPIVWFRVLGDLRGLM